MQFRLGWPLERSYGFWRVAPIYILSGFVGNVVSAIFLPNIVTVGASGAIYGLGGVLVADLMQNWGILRRPWLDAVILVAVIAIALAIGLLPGYDNFTHIGGLVEGVMAGIIFIPSNAARVRRCYRLFRWILVLFTLPVNACFIAFLLIIFYYKVNVNGWCPNCEWLDCVPILNWCDYGKL
jgi:membrane associated rhomboid family serine protease